MARNNHITNSFIAGEASPRFLGRTDTQQYNQSCRELTNAIVFPQGGAAKRGGTVFNAEIVKANGDPAERVRFFPFLGSDGSRWVIVITDALPDAPVGWNPVSSTDPLEWHAYRIDDSYGSGFSIRENVYYNSNASTVGNILKNHYNFGLFYDFSKFQYAQSGDTLIVTSGFKKPFVFTYVPSGVHHKFEMRQYPDPIALLTNPLLWKSVPYAPIVANTASLGITMTITAGVIVLSPGSGSGILFDNSWLGRLIKFTKANVTYIVMVTSITSGTSVGAVAIAGTTPGATSTNTYGGATAGNTYEIQQWNERSGLYPNNDGFPVSVAFFESRLIFGGTRRYPDRLWFSQVNDIYEITFPDLMPQEAGFTDPQVTSDAFQAELKQTLLSDIRWISPGKTLVVGTGSREFVCLGPDQTKSIGIDNFTSNAETPHGSAALQAFRSENTTVFLQRDGRRLRELVYNESEDSFRATNLSAIGEHMHLRSSRRLPDEVFRECLNFMVYQEVPYGIVWIMDGYGNLCALTREREQNVAAWHYHYLGGNGRVRSMAVVPRTAYYFDTSTDTEDDLLCLAVERELSFDTDPAVKRIFMEIMVPQWSKPTLAVNEETEPLAPMVEYPTYLDCACTYSKLQGEGDGLAPGLMKTPYLGVGSVVDVVIDGIYAGKRTVNDDSQIDLTGLVDTSSEWMAWAGFTYDTRIVPVIPEVPARTGSSMGLPRRIERVVLWFHRTCAAVLGKSTHSSDENTPVAPGETVNFPAEGSGLIPMFTGPRDLNYALGYDNETSPVISSDVPLPLEVTHLTAKLAVYE